MAARFLGGAREEIFDARWARKVDSSRSVGKRRVFRILPLAVMRARRVLVPPMSMQRYINIVYHVRKCYTDYV